MSSLYSLLMAEMLISWLIVQNLAMSNQSKIETLIAWVLMIVNLMVTFRPLQFAKNIHLICTLVLFIKRVTIRTLIQAMTVYMLLSLCPNHSKKYCSYQLFIIDLCWTLILLTLPYLQKCNITNTTSLFPQTLNAFHYDCILIMTTSKGNKGTKVTSDHLTHINGLIQILYFWEETNGLYFTFIKVEFIFGILQIIFIRTWWLIEWILHLVIW